MITVPGDDRQIVYSTDSLFRVLPGIKTTGWWFWKKESPVYVVQFSKKIEDMYRWETMFDCHSELEAQAFVLCAIDVLKKKAQAYKDLFGAESLKD